MSNPTNLKYTATHEWVQTLDNGHIRMGLTDHAQSELGDIVFIGLPQEGDDLTAGESLGEVESVKAVSEVLSPVTGTVVAVNEALLDEPGLINSAPYEAWIVEVEGVSGQVELLDAAAYQASVES